MKIFVACDGSKHSEEALKLLGNFPLKDNAEITLVHVNPLVEYDEKFVSENAGRKLEAFNNELEQESDKLLVRSTNILKELGRDSQILKIVGSPVERLVELSQEADLIVMGSRGMNPVKSFFLGSVSDGLVRHANCPILLYRKGEKYQPKTKDFKFVVGYDDTASSRAACSYLKNFDLGRVKEIDLISVMQMNFYYGVSYSLTSLETWPKYKKTIEESMLAMKREIESVSDVPEVNMDIHSEAYDIAEDLNTTAVQEGADIVVVGSKGKNLLDRMFIGSVSNKLAHHADVPLLVVR